jgi:putative Mn2+ efflux pump MntP
MGLYEIILIAIGLSMDAFAVSITLGLSVKKPTIKETLIPGIYFGFFQALMPLAGYFIGTRFVNYVQDYDHWIAFVLLGVIGGKMIMESFSKEEQEVNENPFQFVKMLLLAISTIIDALAVVITFAFFRINIFMAIMLIGFTTFCISIGGVRIGNICGAKFKSKAEFFGGAVLVILGLKMLIEHLFFG